MMDALLRDLRHAWRGLCARPGYAIVTVLTLTLVIGAATAVLAVVNATMVRPLPYPAAERLIQIFAQPPGTSDFSQRNPLSPRTFARFRAGGLASADAVEGFWARDRAIGGEGEPDSVAAAQASAGALPLLGGTTLGRSWTEEEERANARVAVLGHGLWQRRFGGDPAVLGRTLLVDREPYQVIGIMPPGFHALYIQAELWTPLHLTEANIQSPSTIIQTVARLRPGVGVDAMAGEVDAALSRVVDEVPATMKGWTARIAGIREAQFAEQRPALVVLLVAVAALTLIASANLANVTLAQVTARRSETALRAALGAGRTAVVRLQLVESLLLAAAGSMGGLLLGVIALPALLALDPQTAARLGEVRIDWRVQLTIAIVSVAVAIVSGVMPLVRELGRDLARGLTDGSSRTVGSRRDDRLRRLLVALESALAVVLLACGALLLSGFQRTAQATPGFDPTNVLSAQVRLSTVAYPTEEARNEFVTRVLERLRAMPGVEAAATTLNLWIPGFTYQTLVHIDGRPTPDGQPHTVQLRRVSPGYFRTLAIPIARGRDLASSDGADAPGVVVVSRGFAEKFWPGEDPIGRRVRRNAAARLLTVVGVVGDVSDVGFGQAPAETVYVSYLQGNPLIAPIALVVRTTGDPMPMAGAIRSAVLSVDPAQPIDHVTSLERFLEDSLGPQKFRSTLLLVLAGLGLALAAVGIYGVTARAVQERRREVGVRLALGAMRSSVWRLVVGEALVVVGAGMIVGGACALAARAALVHLLPDLALAETWTALPAVLALALAALAAAAVPASRAVAINPIVALRGE